MGSVFLLQLFKKQSPMQMQEGEVIKQHLPANCIINDRLLMDCAFPFSLGSFLHSWIWLKAPQESKAFAEKKEKAY